MKSKNNIYLFVVFILVVISFVTTQLTNDFMPFWAYGRFVYNSEASGFGRLLETWEMKGLLFKIYLSIEYALTAPFSTSFDSYGECIYKIWGIIPFLIILAISIKLFPDKFLPCSLKKKGLFFCASILLLAVHFASHFQAEMWGVVLLLLSFSLYLRDGWLTKVVAAAIYSLTFYLKSPIPLLGGSLVLAAMMLKKQTIKEAFGDIIPFAVGTIITLGSTLALVRFYIPQEFNDIWNASYYQHTLLHPGNNILFSFKRLAYGFFMSFFYNPVILLGICAFCVLIYRWFRYKNRLNILLLCGIWFFPLCYVLLSNCYFVYHFYLCVYASILTLIIFINSGHEMNKKRVAYLSFAVLGFYIIALSSICPSNIREKKNYATMWNENKNKSNSVFVGCQLGKGESVLFLDDGTGAFVFDNPSYLRYFYPLPLQRISSDDVFAQTSLYVETKAKAMNYVGEYITISPWFLNGNNDDLVEKIYREYYLIDEILIPNYSWSLTEWFKNNEESSSILKLYKRKDN